MSNNETNGIPPSAASSSAETTANLDALAELLLEEQGFNALHDADRLLSVAEKEEQSNPPAPGLSQEVKDIINKARDEDDGNVADFLAERRRLLGID